MTVVMLSCTGAGRDEVSEAVVLRVDDSDEAVCGLTGAELKVDELPETELAEDGLAGAELGLDDWDEEAVSGLTEAELGLDDGDD